MLSEINDSLFRIVQEKREQEKLARQKRSLTKDLKQAEIDFDEKEANYLKKYRQLSQLEKARLDKWLPPIGKVVETKILRCKALKTSLNELKVQISETQKQLIEIDQQLENIGEVEKLYKELIQIKEAYLHESDSLNKQELFKQEEIIANIKVDIKEIREALSAGKKALRGFFYLENKIYDPEDELAGVLEIMYWHFKDKKIILKNIQPVQKTIDLFVQELKDVLERMPFQSQKKHHSLLNFSKKFIFQVNGVSYEPQDFELPLSVIRNVKNSTKSFIKKLEKLEKEKLRSLKNQQNKKESFIRDV